jgi:hypothetical protein
MQTNGDITIFRKGVKRANFRSVNFAYSRVQILCMVLTCVYSPSYIFYVLQQKLANKMPIAQRAPVWRIGAFGQAATFDVLALLKSVLIFKRLPLCCQRNHNCVPNWTR